MVQYSLIVLLAAFCGAYGNEYEQHDLVRSGICYERRNAILSLGSLLDPKRQVRTFLNFATGAVYEQSWNSSSYKRLSECKFTLQPTAGHGLYLIIPRMKMRRDAKGNCIDYVSVKQSNGKKTRFCYTPMDVPRSFADAVYLKITIHLDHSIPLATVEDVLHLRMVATQKKECIDSNKDVELRCDPHVLHSCIHRSFINDGIINCPNCIDEPSCDLEPVEMFHANHMKEKLVITGFLSLLATGVVFGAFFLCLYKTRQWVLSCCGSSRVNSSGNGNRDVVTRASRGRTRQGRGNIVAGVHSVELRGSSNDLRPTAPALEEKDLPPSYDALFPTAPVASSTSAGPTTVSAATSPTIPKANMDREVDPA
uniref:Secreted mucin n=1 Tax=Anopheles culicifacies TaxID=139723 RepID=A0A182M4F2_9DIPT